MSFHVSPGTTLSGLGIGVPLLHLSHLNTSGGERLAVGISADGIDARRIGGPVPYTPPDSGGGEDSIRDPDVIFYEPTGEWVMIYTHKVGVTPDDYAATLGVAKCTDLGRWEYVGEITIAGSGITIGTTWAGRWLVEDGRYFFTLLPFEATPDDTPGIGWIECTNPGTWTTWTSYTSLISTNANLTSGTVQVLNGAQIVKIGATYHLWFDAYATGAANDRRLYHSTSSSRFTGYAVPTVVSAGFVSALGQHEGAYYVPLRDGTHRIYMQPVFGGMYYSDSADLTTWSTPAALNWMEPYAMGNGCVVRLDTLAKQAAALTVPASAITPENATFSYVNTIERLYGSSHKWYFGGQTSGNGSATGDIQAITLAKGVSTVTMTVNGTLNFIDGTITNTLSGGNFQLTGAGAFYGNNLTGLSGAMAITGSGGNMTITAGTGNSRSLIFRTTTSGGTATTAMTLNADQSLTSIGGIIFPTSAAAVPSGAWYDNAGTLTKKP